MPLFFCPTALVGVFDIRLRWFCFERFKLHTCFVVLPPGSVIGASEIIDWLAFVPTLKLLLPGSAVWMVIPPPLLPLPLLLLLVVGVCGVGWLFTPFPLAVLLLFNDPDDCTNGKLIVTERSSLIVCCTVAFVRALCLPNAKFQSNPIWCGVLKARSNFSCHGIRYHVLYSVFPLKMPVAAICFSIYLIRLFFFSFVSRMKPTMFVPQIHQIYRLSENETWTQHVNFWPSALNIIWLVAESSIRSRKSAISFQRIMCCTFMWVSVSLCGCVCMFGVSKPMLHENRINVARVHHTHSPNVKPHTP